MTQQLTRAMTQQQTAAVLPLPERRGPERQCLFLAINSLKAAQANLDASNRAVSDDFNSKMTAKNELDELRAAATEMGSTPLLDQIEKAVESGVEPLRSTFRSAEEEQLATKFKSCLQSVEFHNRRRAAREAVIPGEEATVERGRRKVRQCALDVIRATDAPAIVANDLSVMQAALVEKRCALHFFISNDLVDDAPALQRLMVLETESWRRHPAVLKWSAALERLMADADAELPAA
ncbi:MAG: hypothetical protein WCC90_02970 [Methylocella sp.]